LRKIHHDNKKTVSIIPEITLCQLKVLASNPACSIIAKIPTGDITAKIKYNIKPIASVF